MAEYSLGLGPHGDELTASEVYDTLQGARESVIVRARVMAELTIPSVFPPEGYRTGDDIPGNNQSVGAQCVNNLASNLMFLAFPPGRPILEYVPIEHKLQNAIEQDPETYSLILLALSRLEIEHRKRLETTPISAAYVEFVKSLLVAGNTLWKHLDLDCPAFYNMTQYVVKRDNTGMPLLTILKEGVAVAQADDDLRKFIYDISPELKEKPLYEQEADIYSCCKLIVTSKGKKGKHWEFWQEYEGFIIEGSYYKADFETPPLWPAWLIPVYGQDWGRSYCEEYRGDLFTVENFMSSLNDAAAAASLVMWFVKPGSTTSAKEIREAENLSVHSGSAEDVTTLKLDKTGDLQFVSNNVSEAAKRLEYAFMMNQAVQRDAERVTAEEIKTLAITIDKAMGGVYTMQASGNQRIIIKRAIELHNDEDPNLPDPMTTGVVRMEIATGVGSLGQSIEEQGLVELGSELAQMFGPQWGAMANVTSWANRLAAAKGINPQGLFKDTGQIAQEKSQAQSDAAKQTLLEKGTGPAVQALAKGASQQMLPPPNQGNQPPPPQGAPQPPQQGAPVNG